MLPLPPLPLLPLPVLPLPVLPLPLLPLPVLPLCVVDEGQGWVVGARDVPPLPFEPPDPPLPLGARRGCCALPPGEALPWVPAGSSATGSGGTSTAGGGTTAGSAAGTTDVSGVAGVAADAAR